MKELRLFLWLVLLTGLVYPMLITAIAAVAMKEKSRGEIILYQNRPVGSRLLAQKFESDRYFWPRPSAVDYNPLPSGGSNLGPTSLALKQTIEMRKKRFLPTSRESIPSDLLFASGSGLDPHISLSAAYYQLERVGKARGYDAMQAKKILENLIANSVEGGMLGKSYVNVLLLNLALDSYEK